MIEHCGQYHGFDVVVAALVLQAATDRSAVRVDRIQTPK